MAWRALLLAAGGFLASSTPQKGSARIALSGADGAPEQMCQIEFDETGTISRPPCVINVPQGGMGEFIFRPMGELDPTLLAAEETDLWRADVVSRAPLSGADGAVAVPPVRASPRVILVHRCSLTTSCFRFRLALPPATRQAPAAEYKMSVFLEQTHFSRLTLRSETCNGVRAPHTLRFSVFVRVLFEPGLARPALQFFEEEDEESALEFKLAPPMRALPSASPSPGVEKKRRRGGRRLLEAAPPATEEPAEEAGEGEPEPPPPPPPPRRVPPSAPRTFRAPAAAVARPAVAAGAVRATTGAGTLRAPAQRSSVRVEAFARPSASPSALRDGGACQHISTAVDAHTFGPTGWYVLRHDMFGDVSTWHWQPAGGCAFPMPASAAAVRPQLHGRWTAFVGDLTVAEMAIALLLLADVHFERRWAALCAEDAEGPVRAFDTGSLPALGGGRVTMFWAASAEACGQRSDGLRAFADAAFQARFREFHAPEAETGRTPSVLVFNSGLHDLAAPDLTSESFGASLRTHALPLLREVLPRGRLVWRSSTPKTGGVECLAGGGGSAGNAGVDELNDVAWRVISEAWAPEKDTGAVDGAEEEADAAVLQADVSRPLFLDANALLRPFFEPSELARHHCSSLTRDGEQTISRVRSGCLAVASALVTLVAPPSPSRSSTPTPTRSPSISRSRSPTASVSGSAPPPSRSPSVSRSPRPSLLGRPRAPPPAPAAIAPPADIPRVDNTAVVIAVVCLVNIAVVVGAWIRCGASTRGAAAGAQSPADHAADHGSVGRRGAGARVRGFVPRS